MKDSHKTIHLRISYMESFCGRFPSPESLEILNEHKSFFKHTIQREYEAQNVGGETDIRQHMMIGQGARELMKMGEADYLRRMALKFLVVKKNERIAEKLLQYASNGGSIAATRILMRLSEQAQREGRNTKTAINEQTLQRLVNAGLFKDYKTAVHRHMAKDLKLPHHYLVRMGLLGDASAAFAAIKLATTGGLKVSSHHKDGQCYHEFGFKMYTHAIPKNFLPITSGKRPVTRRNMRSAGCAHKLSRLRKTVQS